jgi:hypothetical protein
MKWLYLGELDPVRIENREWEVSCGLNPDPDRVNTASRNLEEEEEDNECRKSLNWVSYMFVFIYTRTRQPY